LHSVPPPTGAACDRAPRPKVAADAVSRRALMLRLAGSPAAVVLLVAPAGFGKTTTLAQWAAAGGRPVAWVTVDERDDDPDRLAAGIAAALPGSATGPAGLNELVAAPPEPFLLVVDDAHRLRSPEALAVLDGVVHQLAEGSQLAIAARQELELPYGRLAAEHRLLRLTARDLAMSAAEGAALVAAAGVDLPARDVETLVRRTDGWPAALSLLVQTLKEPGYSAADVADLGGRDQLVGKYAWDEVLGALDPMELEFLLAISVLDRFGPPLCDAVLATRGSARTLDRLAQGDVPLVRLDPQGEWLRLNRLLQEVLLVELRRRDPGAEERIQARASRWWERRGDVEAAVRHARSAGTVDRAAELVSRLLPEYVLAGNTTSISTLLDGFAERELREAPALAIAKAWESLAAGSLEATRHWSELAVHAAGAEAGAPSGPAAEAALALLRAARAADGVAAMGADAALAHAVVPAGSPWRSLTAYLQGVSALLTGDAAAGRTWLREAGQLASTAAPALEAIVLAHLASLECDDGDLDEARVLAWKADAIVHQHGLEEHPGLALVDAVAAALLAKEGNESAARDRAHTATVKLAAMASMAPWMEAQAKLLVGFAQLQLGNAAAARALEREAGQAVRTGAADATALCDRLEALQGTLDAFPAIAIPGAGHLTPAELRVLRHLPTHLSFRQIGERLYLSRHTVKTEAISTYRKLGVNSRSEAVRRAHELGLL
jgi:LuxR family maltose regulon positive regulatory protein